MAKKSYKDKVRDGQIKHIAVSPTEARTTVKNVDPWGDAQPPIESVSRPEEMRAAIDYRIAANEADRAEIDEMEEMLADVEEAIAAEFPEG